MLPDRDGSGLVQRKSHHDLEERFPLWPVVQLLVSISNNFFMRHVLQLFSASRK